MEWAILAVCVGMVLAAECLNTALERLSDRVAPERHPLVGQAKDAAAAAVLVAAMVSVAAGLLILGPKLWLVWRTLVGPGR